MNARYNAVIVGQTGVGKSSLINYLYGHKVAETGVGKPVTKNGFHPIDFEINGLPVRLFDSWGLEVGSYEKWMLELENELQTRSVNESADKWFHSVFYCIQAGGARVQECDIAIIRKFINANYKVSVILTKCDQVALDVEEALKAELQKQINGLSVMSVCSTTIKTRTGVSEQFGKEDVERQAFNDFFDSLILRLPLRCRSVTEDELKTWKIKSKEKVIKDTGFLGRNQTIIQNELTNSAQELAKRMTELVNFEVKKTFEMYGVFASHLGYPPSGFHRTRGYFNTKKDDDELSLWVKIPLYTVLLPVKIVWTLFTAKNNATEELEEYISTCEGEFQRIIREHVKNVTRMLESAKLKVTEQK